MWAWSLQDLPAGGPVRAGGAGDGRVTDDRHEQAQRALLHPVQRGHHAAQRAGELGPKHKTSRSDAPK